MAETTSKLFISHSSEDDAFVRGLRETLALHGQDGWIDSRELRGGDPLWTEIQKAIDVASAYAVVVSPEGLQSKWVGKELRHALDLQKQRGRDKFPVFPLSLNDTKLGVLEEFFGEEPVYIRVSSDAGGIEAALNPILVALGKRLGADVAPTPQPKAEPLEELVLELTDLKFHEQDGVRRASARARLVYEPARVGQREVASEKSWRLVAPLGPIEMEDLRWYLQEFAIWPSGLAVIQERARRVEESLVTWGRLLHEAAMPVGRTANVMQAWAKIDGHTGRRFSVHVDAALEEGVPEADVKVAKEAATLLLGLPWELLHDGDGYLFQGAKPTRVRRRLPNTKVLDVQAVATPIRILLVTARPEDDACLYIDHRASALPLVEAMEALGGLVQLHVLSPPTLPALREELDRARRVGEPYHLVHFDGHGVYDRGVGLGGLCFEHPEDAEKLEKRRHLTVFTNELGPLLRDHRIPLVFLEACQTATAEKPSESVASELLKVGVASVVAMSHSVLVETARRFVEAFYDSLAGGARVGDAMLQGQRTLKDDTLRGRVFGAGELRLEDWFVPVLFQEKDDPQLFRTTPAKHTKEDLKAALNARLGELPFTPATGFIGRSRDLLALERLLSRGRYAVIRGQGGEGKTALAAELARWMVRSQQIRRVAFVSVEMHSNVGAVLDAVGRQLVGKDYSVATFENLEKAILPIERALTEQSTLLVVDNMESILLPPFMQEETPEALSEEARRELGAILELCARLNGNGDTRIVFTSREALPAPFEAERHRRELHQLDREDAIKLVERVLNQEGAGAGASAEAAREAIEQLVDAVNCHARTLALLAPALCSHGVEASRASLVELMAEMERKFPGSREQSVFASVELSLRRMSPANWERARVLGVFYGGIDLAVLHEMMQWEEADVRSLAGDLIETGLATPNRYGHLTLNPALCPYLRGQMDAVQRETLTTRWGEAMLVYVAFLVHEQYRNAEVAVTLTRLGLRNLFALLEGVERRGDADATIDLATSLFSLVRLAGKPRLLQRVQQAHDAAVAKLGDIQSRTRFKAQFTGIEQELAGGALHGALEGAQKLLLRAQVAGDKAYPGADYDLAMAIDLVGQTLFAAGHSDQALVQIEEAQRRFEDIERERPGCGAKRMVFVCDTRRAHCLTALGRLGEAASTYEDAMRRAEDFGDVRSVAALKGGLGTARLRQSRYGEALKAHKEARDWFTRLGEPSSVAASWHLTGMVYEQMGRPEAADDAYRRALAIYVRLGDVAGQTGILNQLGNLCYGALDCPEKAAVHYRQAADNWGKMGDTASEGGARSNLAESLRKLRRFDEARREISRAVICKEPFGHAAEPWVMWQILCQIETDTGNLTAAEEARRRAIDCYLAYRRDGGENQSGPGRLVCDMTKRLREGGPVTVTAFLQHLATDAKGIGPFRPFIKSLQAIVAGSRDRTLADAPDLDVTMAAEILFLIETLASRDQ